jgi:hypothetical protein
LAKSPAPPERTQKKLWFAIYSDLQPPLAARRCEALHHALFTAECSPILLAETIQDTP